MQNEILNLEYHTARLTVKAINTSKSLEQAAKLLGITPAMIYGVLRRNRIITKKNEKGRVYVEKGGIMIYRDGKGKIIKTII